LATDQAAGNGIFSAKKILLTTNNLQARAVMSAVATFVHLLAAKD